MKIDIDKELLKNSALAWFYVSVRNRFSLSTTIFFFFSCIPFSGAVAYTETNVENSNLNRKNIYIFFFGMNRWSVESFRCFLVLWRAVVVSAVHYNQPRKRWAAKTLCCKIIERLIRCEINAISKIIIKPLLIE